MTTTPDCAADELLKGQRVALVGKLAGMKNVTSSPRLVVLIMSSIDCSVPSTTRLMFGLAVEGGTF